MIRKETEVCFAGLRSGWTLIQCFAVICFVVCASFVDRPAHAQLTTGTVVGTVTDTSGAVIPGAKVTLTNLGTGVSSAFTTNGTGDYTFNSLIPGQYSIRIEAKSFKRTLIPTFALAAGDRLRENATMEPGSQQETVEVTSSEPLLQTDSASVQSTVTEESVQNLPLNGRNYINLVQVQPGVNEGQPGAISSGGRPDDRRQTSTVVANGQSDLFNNELIDGMDNNEREQGFIGVRPSIDAIAEVQVQTNDFPAEIGRSAGAVVNIITKSGTDHFHGSVYEYFRNDIFDARDWFAKVGKTKKPEYRQNQFGGSIGGPIIRKKAFFFGDVEDNRVIQGLTGTVTVPTLYEEQNPGDFSDIGGPKVTTGLDPIGEAYFSMYPPPTNSGIVNNYTSVVSQPQTTFTTDGRIDYHFNNGDVLFGRYSYNNIDTKTPGWFPQVNVAGANIKPSGNLNGFPGESIAKVHGVALSYTHVFTPNLAMELKTGYTRIAIDTQNLNAGFDASSAIGLPNANTPLAPNTSGLMPISPTGYAALGDSYFTPIIDTNNTFEYMGSLTYTHGRHNIKGGAQIIRRQLNYFQSSFPLGFTLFFGVTGNALEDLLTGTPGGYLRGDLLISPGYRAWEEGYYLQDDWRVNSKLTLNLGLRYDVYTPITEAHNRYSNFLYPTLTLVTGNQDPHIGIETNYKDFAPRFGFSESITPKTVLRGGYGISYYPLDTQTRIQNANPPYSFAATCIPCFGWWPNLPDPTPSSTTDLSGSLNYNASDLNTGYVQQFNLMLQRQFGANVLTVGGVGELGRHALFDSTANYPVPSGPYPDDAATGPSATPPLLTAASLPNVSTIGLFNGGATSNYYALQATFDRRFTNGLAFNANYTWAHDLTDGYIGSNFGTVTGLLPSNPHYDYGNAGVDIRHRFATTWTYALPFGENAQGAPKMLLGGWTANMLLFWQTGQVFTVSDGFTGNPTGLAQINLPTVTSDRPSMVTDQSYKSGKSGLNGTSYLNLNAFTPQEAGTPGNEANGQSFGPHTRRADFSLFKNFTLPEKMTLQFRAEVYNISNTPNFAPPASSITGWTEGSGHDYLHPIEAGDNPTFCSASDKGCTAVGLLPGDKPTTAGGFGSISSTVMNINPRQFQFALKLLF